MAQEQQRSREDRSPYVADESGGVGHLGQPDRPSQAPGDRGLHFGGKDTGSYGDTQPVNVEAGAPRQQQQHHPLEATHDTNIGHGHEPFSSGYVAPAGAQAEQQQRQRGMGEKMKDAVRGAKDVVGGHRERQHGDEPGVPYEQQQQPKSPGIVGKVKDAVTGQKPGYGTASGYATSGGAVPGEEDYAGKFQGQGAEKPHDTNWPRPVPPPGMFKQSDSPREPGYTSGVTGAGDKPGYTSGHHQDVGIGLHGDKSSDPNVGTGHEAYSGGKSGIGAGGEPRYDSEQQSYGEQKNFQEPEPGTGGLMGTKYNTGAGQTEGGIGGAAYTSDRPADQVGQPHPGAYDRDERSDAYGSDRSRPGAYDRDEKTGAYGSDQRRPGDQDRDEQRGTYTSDQAAGGYSLDEKPGVTQAGPGTYSRDEKPAVGQGVHGGTQPPVSGDQDQYEHFSTPGAASTPTAPNARHDTPTAGNDAGAEYKDARGGVHKEGPRDDNVKKEGLMAKVMDKLHLGSSHKKKDAPTTP